MTALPNLTPVRAVGLRLGAACALVAVLGTASCNTQRIPGPMPLDGAPAELAYPPGPAEAVVVRHSDPVYVRRAGAPAGVPLAFYDKRDRVASGGWVLSGAGGRAELLWPGDASSVVLFDEGAVQVGEPSRGEPIASFVTVSRARVQLAPGKRLGLWGGALLQGDALMSSGPFTLERVDDDILRVENHSRMSARIDYREERLDLGPGESVDLPVLAVGSVPFDLDPGRMRLREGGVDAAIGGRVQTVASSSSAAGPAWLHLVALQESRVGARGVEVKLTAGEELVFADLGGQNSPDAAPPSVASNRRSAVPANANTSPFSEPQ